MCIVLDQKHAVLCAVSEGTRLLLEEQAAKRGIDVAAARERGQYVCLGVDVLSDITHRGRPYPMRFHEVIGGHVKRFVQEYPGVWMYGELAAIMWGQGVERGAIELDRLWASLAEWDPVVLCAALPVEALSWPIVVKALQQEVAEQVRKLAKGSFDRAGHSPRANGFLKGRGLNAPALTGCRRSESRLDVRWP